MPIRTQELKWKKSNFEGHPWQKPKIAIGSRGYKVIHGKNIQILKKILEREREREIISNRL
jgi:hypothetical protein